MCHRENYIGSVLYAHRHPQSFFQCLLVDHQVSRPSKSAHRTEGHFHWTMRVNILPFRPFARS